MRDWRAGCCMWSCEICDAEGAAGFKVLGAGHGSCRQAEQPLLQLQLDLLLHQRQEFFHAHAGRWRDGAGG